MKRPILSLLRVVAAILIFSVASAKGHPAPPLKVGVGRRSITPETEMWLGGYAARKTPSTGKLHEIFAKAIAFEDDAGSRAVVVAIDLVGVTPEVSRRVAELVQQSHELPRDRLMLTVTHTHSAPVIRGNLESMYPLDETQRRLVHEYTDALPGKIAGAVGDAINSLEPCRVARGHASARFAINRRQYARTGIGFGVNPAGPVDNDVPVIFAFGADGSVKAALFGYACHNTTLDGPMLSGDYAGFAEIQIEDALPGALALFVSGAGADINPNPRGKVEHARRHGLELAGAVVGALAGPLDDLRGPIQMAYKEVPLKLTEPPTREALDEQMAKGDIYTKRRAERLVGQLNSEGGIPRAYPYPVQTLRFGEAAPIVALGGEVVVDYALRLKHELGPDAFIIGYANDVMAYIPSLRILKEGGYEGGGAMLYYGLHGPWEPEVEQTIITTVHELVGE